MRCSECHSPPLLAAALLCLLGGCGDSTTVVTQVAQPAKPSAAKIGPPAVKPPQSTLPLAAAASPQPPVEKALPPPLPPALAVAPAAEPARPSELFVPRLDEARIQAAGLRKLAGRHIDLYTDLPASKELDELPRVFDAAVRAWTSYFGIDPAASADWKIVGSVMQNKERFVASGLYPADLPDFPHGYSRAGQIWLFDQPSGYYRRHLVLHEGTHCFMQQFFGGAGPPWYMEGIAELLGTHRWQDGKLTLGIMPATKEEVPYWGRIKIVKDELAAGRGMSLDEILRYDNRAHLRNEPYGWCWAAAWFFDQHPLTQAAFRELKREAHDQSRRLSRRFRETLDTDWAAIREDWQVFVSDCEYGYDVARAAVMRRPAADLPTNGATVSIAADRGWQSSGLRLVGGKAYRVAAAGRFQVGNQPAPWPCEAGGVTIRYHQGQPLGMLLFAMNDLEGEPPAWTPLARPQPIGQGGQLTPERTGTLYFKINEAASGLADNAGELRVSVRQE